MNKIAVINFSGNVGKSTVAEHLLAPRMGDAPILRVESINSDGGNDPAMRGAQFRQIHEYLQTVPKAVVDIGASNVEDYINLMTEYKGSFEDYDLFVVPTVSALKQQIDTMSTLTVLSGIGIPKSKIRLLFNMRDIKTDMRYSFKPIEDYYQKNDNFVLNWNAAVDENPLYEQLRNLNKSIADITADPTDYVAKNAEAVKNGAPEDEKAHIRRMIAITRLARRVSPHLDQVHKELVS